VDPWTGSFGGQAAADPNHRSANGAADSPATGLQRSDESPLPSSLALLALLLPSDVDVHGMDQHLEITSFLVMSVSRRRRSPRRRHRVSDRYGP
jgi:hypothetical protein